MAEAPNILFLLSLTPCLDSHLSSFICVETCVILTFFMWIREQCESFLTQVQKATPSNRATSRQRHSAKSILRYHCFKQRMRFKRSHKNQFVKPQPLFYLTWKGRLFYLTFYLFLYFYVVGCRVERLIGSFFKRLLYGLHIRHRSDLNLRVATCASYRAYQSIVSLLHSTFQPRLDTNSFKLASILCVPSPCPAKRNVLKNCTLMREQLFLELPGASSSKVWAPSVSSMWTILAVAIPFDFLAVSKYPVFHRRCFAPNNGPKSTMTKAPILRTQPTVAS